jgi:hypothetical protein
MYQADLLACINASGLLEVAVTISEKRVEKEHEGDLNVTTIKVLTITTQLPFNSHGRIRHIAHGQRPAPPANTAASTPLKLTSAVLITNTAACRRKLPRLNSSAPRI